MNEQTFLASLQQSMHESERLQLALGHTPQRAMLEQVQMLREAGLPFDLRQEKVKKKA